MKKFLENLLTASQARKLMPMTKAKELVSSILVDVSTRAQLGHYDVRTSVSTTAYTELDMSETVKILEKLGYHVVTAHIDKSVWFLIDWRP